MRQKNVTFIKLIVIGNAFDRLDGLLLRAKNVVVWTGFVYSTETEFRFYYVFYLLRKKYFIYCGLNCNYWPFYLLKVLLQCNWFRYTLEENWKLASIGKKDRAPISFSEMWTKKLKIIFVRRWFSLTFGA